MWFLPCMFLVFLIFGNIQKIKSNFIISLLTILLLFLGYLLGVYTNCNFLWSFDVVLIALSFYSFGFYAKKVILSLFNKKFVFLLLLSFIIHISCYLYNSKIDMYRSIYGVFPLFIVGGISGSFFWISFFKLLPCANFLSFLGRNTITVYGLNQPISTPL